MQLNSFLTKLILLLIALVALASTVFGISISAEVKDTSFYFSGYTSPNSLIYFEEGGIIIGTASSDVNGFFEKYILAVDPGIHSINIWSTDVESVSTSIINFTLLVLAKQEMALTNIYLPATTSILDNYITSHEDIFIWGYAKPNEDIEIVLSGAGNYTYVVTANSDGYYSLALPSDNYPNGDYSLTTEVLIEGIIDNPTISDPITFTLDNPPLPSPSPSPSISPSPSPSLSPSPMPSYPVVPSIITSIIPTDTIIPSFITITPTIDEGTDNIIYELPLTGVSDLASLISIIIMILILLFLLLTMPQFILLAIAIIRYRKEDKLFGIILDSKTNNPIPFALIRVYDSSGKLKFFTLSDLDGKYYLILDKGDYTIIISHASYIYYTKKFSIFTDSYKYFEDHSLEPKTNPSIFESLLTRLEHLFNSYLPYIWNLGFILCIFVCFNNPQLINTFILTIYLLEILIYILIKRRNVHGIIYDIKKDEGIKGIFVSLMNKDEKRLVDIVMSDELGRFAFKIDDKEYLLTIETDRKVKKCELKAIKLKNGNTGFIYSKKNKDIRIGLE